MALTPKVGGTTGKFMRQGHTTDGMYGSDTNPKELDGAGKPATDLKP